MKERTNHGSASTDLEIDQKLLQAKSSKPGGPTVASVFVVATDSKPDVVPSYPRIEIEDLFNIAETQDRLDWQPYQEGVDIHRLYGDGIEGPTAALIRFRKAGKIRLHKHTGYEHILVLARSQRDQNSEVKPGTLVINPPGTSHSVVCEAGCIVLAIYEKPVAFAPDAGPEH